MISPEHEVNVVSAATELAGTLMRSASNGVSYDQVNTEEAAGHLLDMAALVVQKNDEIHALRKVVNDRVRSFGEGVA